MVLGGLGVRGSGGGGYLVAADPKSLFRIRTLKAAAQTRDNWSSVIVEAMT